MKKSAQIVLASSSFVLASFVFVSIAQAGAPGDTNGDGTTDLFDYNASLAQYGSSECDLAGDMDDDCDVDAADVAYTISNQGEVGRPDEAVVCPLDPNVPGRILVRLSEGASRSEAQFIRSDRTEERSRFGPVQTNIPAGDYRVTMVSYDDHTKRPSQAQNEEQWYLELGNATQSRVALTSTISDLPDDDAQGNPQDWLTEEVDASLIIGDDITSALAIHAAYPVQNANSIVPVCAAFDLNVVVPQCAIDPTVITFDEKGYEEGHQLASSDADSYYRSHGISFRMTGSCGIPNPQIAKPGNPLKAFVTNNGTIDDLQFDCPDGAACRRVSTGSSLTDSGYANGVDVDSQPCTLQIDYEDVYRTDYVTFDLLDIDHNKNRQGAPVDIESFTAKAYDELGNELDSMSVNGYTDSADGAATKVTLQSPNEEEIARVVVSGRVSQ